jgi:hypothetical protein
LHRGLLISLGLLVVCSLTSRAADWPQWRGVDGQGHSSATDLPITWSEEKNVAWKTELPGRGYSSPDVDGNLIWLTTALETPADPVKAKERLKANTGGQPLTLLDQVEFRAVCVARDTGKILRDVSLMTEKDPQWVHTLNSYASPTPILQDGRLYCHFGTFGTVCVNSATGEILWRNTELHCMHENGPGGSPVLWKNDLIVMLDGSDVQYVAALDKDTGKVLWKTTRSGELRSDPQLKKSYGTPLIVNVNGQEQLIAPGADWLYGYDPATGRELWKMSYGMLGFSITPRPVAGHGMLFMSTGFMKPDMLGIRYEGQSQPEIVWHFKQGAPTMPSPLLVGDELYFMSDGGIFTCLDAVSGKEHYRQRLGGNFSSSPLYADGKIYVCSREGVTHVIQPGKEFKSLGNSDLGRPIMASPIALDHALFLRTDKALYRIEKAK